MAYIGTIIGGKYKIIKEIGRGGMASVYLVWDNRLNKQWAVKEIKKYGINDKDYQKNSFDEADIIKSCDHPVLPRIVDIIYENNATFIVMDYIEGTALSEVLKKEGSQDCGLVVEWMKSICEALIYLHGLNPPVLYLDLKPSNIILKHDKSIKLIDFGISFRMFERSNISKPAMGTIGYASPEQMGYYSGKAVHSLDERSDIYSFGATMYTLITGKIREVNEFDRKDLDLDIPDGVMKIIDKCMQCHREDRYQSFNEVMFNLCNYEKLDRRYKGLCLKRVGVWFLSLLMSAFFAMGAMYSYKGIQNNRDEQYEKMITDAYEYVIKGDYEKALEDYSQAICRIDGNRNAAYVDMLNLYTDYIDDCENGISKVSYYIEKEHEEGIERAELFMKLGLVCFSSEKDYKKSAYYFSKAKDEGCRDAEMYLNFANALSELNIDYQKLGENLDEFGKNTDGMTDRGKKLDNYVLICDVLLKHGNGIEDGMIKLVENAEKGLKILGETQEEILNAGYYISFYQGLLSGAEAVGDCYISAGVDKGLQYYNKAYESCEKLLEIVSDDDNVVMGSSKAYEYRRAKLCKKAELLSKLSRYDEACDVYELGENEYGSEGGVFYVGHLMLLCELEERRTPDVEKWNIEKLTKLYEKGNELDGIGDDYRWKRLVVKLKPIIEKGG